MLSDLQTKKLTRYFQVYDIDDDGHIDSADFDRIVHNVMILHWAEEGSETTDALREAYRRFWQGLKTAADGDGDGGVSLDEWLAYWQVALENDDRYETEVHALTNRLFTVFDLDEDDTIGAAEFMDFFGVFGLQVDLAESVFVELDTNGDGVISRDELLDVARDFYRSDDPEAPGNLLFGPFGV